jgi:hypothetical protein
MVVGIRNGVDFITHKLQTWKIIKRQVFYREFEVIDAIKAAYDSNPVKNIENTVTFIGQWQNMNIKIVKENGIIKSAYLD